ncbi:SulP family inorganic anion transporter [Notoacmeibacter sp. MSK16QG-6]|uniref:SulP family inorganic anion transporter n=1 Tax=Notoacmeibacter sp. MSK16QG-6 TaxID=2957982 RepID=UPI0020A1C294|nr:sulfate permease [Notoacmeibacter sp. MSK16QG-6]MCP1197948.1 sulfate permease [Notoacmeibacter sp. MSK16QG-6]
MHFLKSFARYLPCLDWGRQYDRATLTSDIVAAIIVTIMLIPQSLAYALLAGLPPVVGLYASILPLIAYALFGTSRTLAVGPVAVVSLLTAAAVGEIAASGTADYLTAALVLAFLSGIILLTMGLFRLGFVANLLSHPVISGFITASAIIIALSQARHILGVEGGGDTLIEIVGGLVATLSDPNATTLVIGVASLAFLFWVRQGFRPLLLRLGLSDFLAGLIARTGPVLAVVVAVLAVAALRLDLQGVAIVGEIPQGLPPLTLPFANHEMWVALLPAAFLISIVGFVESISVAQTLAARRRQSIDPDQELVGLGAANIAAGLTGGYPVTGGFARSVVNFDAGAKTPAAGAFTAIGILLASLILTPLLYFLPIAVLAATIIVAVLSLVDVKTMKETWAYSKADFAATAMTILATLGFGVETGLIAGVALSIVLYLYQTSRPHVAIVGQVPGTEHFRNIDRHDVVTSSRVLTLRFDESLYFANARAVEARIQEEVAARPGLKHLVLQCPAVNFIDASGLESLEMTVRRLESAGIDLHLSEVKGPVMDRLKRSHLLDEMTGRVFLTQHQAMRTLDPETTIKADEMVRPEIVK